MTKVYSRIPSQWKTSDLRWQKFTPEYPSPHIGLESGRSYVETNLYPPWIPLVLHLYNPHQAIASYPITSIDSDADADADADALSSLVAREMSAKSWNGDVFGTLSGYALPYVSAVIGGVIVLKKAFFSEDVMSHHVKQLYDDVILTALML